MRMFAAISILFFVPDFYTSVVNSQETKLTATNNVVVSIAMEAEAAPLIQKLGLEKNDGVFPSQVPFEAYSGTICNDGTKITVVTNGKDSVYNTGVDNVGTVPAALATFLVLQNIPDADILINAGTCGGFGRKGAEIGDVFLTTEVVNHDRRIPIPPFIPYGIGKLKDENIDVTKLAAQHSFKTGICTTGNSLDATPEDRKLMLENDASVKDMEAAAIAWSCKLHDTPFLGVKVVTDIVDGDVPTQDEFMQNLSTAANSLQSAVPKILESLCSKENHTEL
mmetsp:Transcript_1434/g.1740  ORF Transcript_1434/g.1740 Transcript_1434/m.1740 type:complete len:280 (+) Transcript_1434:109-948(+)